MTGLDPYALALVRALQHMRRAGRAPAPAPTTFGDRGAYRAPAVARRRAANRVARRSRRINRERGIR